MKSFLSVKTEVKKKHLLTILQLLENQATSKHIGIYCNNKGLCLTTSLNHPNHIWLWKNSITTKQFVFSWETSEGEQHLGAVICSEAFTFSYTKLLVDDWIKQLKLLSIIAESEPQSAYSAFIGGFKWKLPYFFHTLLLFSVSPLFQ